MGGYNVRGFAPDQFDAACDFLRIPPSQRQEIAAAVRDLTVEVSAPPQAPAIIQADLVGAVDRVRDTVGERVDRIRAKSTQQSPK